MYKNFMEIFINIVKSATEQLNQSRNKQVCANSVPDDLLILGNLNKNLNRNDVGKVDYSIKVLFHTI